MERKHFPELDSLRGLAAVAVMMSHWAYIWESEPHPWWAEQMLKLPPFKTFVNGHAAVYLFFVLSGFVLALPQVRGKEVRYASFLMKRICRIYLPYLVALGLAVAGCWRYHGLNAYGQFFQDTWAGPPQWNTVLPNILLIGSYRGLVYNNSFWSLFFEMRISLAFPFLCAFALRLGATGGLLLAAAFLGIEAAVAPYFVSSYEVPLTLGYAAVFLFGILVARYRQELEARLRRLNTPAYWGLLIAALLVYTYWSSVVARLQWYAPLAALPTVASGCLMILYSLSEGLVRRVLNWRPLVFLGRISYSLYLLQSTMLFVFAYVFHNVLTPAQWLAPYVAITLALAALMYRWVEAPAIALGRYLTSEARPRVATGSTTSSAA